MLHSSLRSCRVLLALGLIGSPCLAAPSWAQNTPPTPGAGSLRTPYIDPKQQTTVEFGQHSHHLQPWRGYQETIRAVDFLNSFGINAGVPDGMSADLICQMLAKCGVRHGRVEFGWADVRRDGTLTDGARRKMTANLKALQKHGIRPLILLNAHSGVPGDIQFFDRTLAAPARKGDRTIRLTDTSNLTPHLSGLRDITDYWASEALFTQVDGELVTLSKPLPKDLGEAGATVKCSTLAFRPFGPESAAHTQETLAGWKAYVRTIAQAAAEILGTTNATNRGFDLEIWNELTFGSHFLNINDYYDPPLYPREQFNPDSVWSLVVRATVELGEKEPGLFQGVTLCNGFTNTMPWFGTGEQPPRVAALSKHPYAGRQTYPKDRRDNLINALGQLEEKPTWYPAYSQLFPEYFGTWLQTESVLREASPITTDLYGTKRGRYARIIVSKPLPVETWFTEIGLAPDEHGITDRQAAMDLKAKTTARYLTFWNNKGVQRIYFYTAIERDTWLGMVTESFQQYARENTTYPADDSAYLSPALRVMGRMAAKMRQGLDRNLTTTRSLPVESIPDTHGHFQWQGDGTEAHSTLYNREVLAILPVQVSARRFVVPYYVMTRDIQKPLAPEQYTVRLGGVRGRQVRATVYDPITDKAVPVRITGRTDKSVTLRLTATDYPYLLTLED